MRSKEIFRNIGLAAVLATGSVAASAAVENPTSAATVRTHNCSRTGDRWYALTKGEYNVVKASGVILPADVTVDGVRQFDDNPDTASVTVLKGKHNLNKTWIIYPNYDGSMEVKICGATHASTEKSAGENGRTSDLRLGTNNPVRSVQFNWIEK